MDTQALEALRAELHEAKPALDGIIEGLRHVLEQKDLSAENRAEVQGLLDNYLRRENLRLIADTRASATFDGVTALLSDGYPDLPVRDIDPDTFDAIEQNRQSIELAHGQFRRREVTTEGASTVGPEEPVP